MRRLWRRWKALPAEHPTLYKRLLQAFLVALTAVTIRGLAALWDAVNMWAAFGLAAVFCLAATPNKVKARVLEWLGALTISLATLLGFNVVLDWVIRKLGWYHEDSSRWWILAGMVTGFAVYAGAAYVYLRRRGHWCRLPAGIVAPVSGVLLIFITPLVWAYHKEKADEKPVPPTALVPSELDAYIVAETGRRSAPPDPGELPTRPGLRVRYSVGFADGEKVRWAFAGTDQKQALAALEDESGETIEKPAPREGADHVLVLVVDPTPAVAKDPAALPDVKRPQDEVKRWERIARSTRLGDDVPTYALLQTTETARLERWDKAGAPIRKEVSVQGFGSSALTDAAVRLAVAAPTSSEDFSLAFRHRPVLLFDENEQVPRPLSIEALFARKKISQCPVRGVCGEPLTDMSELENGDTRLEIDRPKSDELRALAMQERNELRRRERAAPDAPRAGTDDPGAAPKGTPPAGEASASEPADLPTSRIASRIYVHTTSRVINDESLLYLDYWWYLPDNPARAGSGAFCGAALVIPGITCFDHQSDWEGVTVVVRRTQNGRALPKPKPIAVQYAEHESTVRYPWDQLRERWGREQKKLGELTRGAGDVSERPLVFVARGTHASYPVPCPPPRAGKSKCRETAVDLEEQPQTGTLPWAGNGAETCGGGSACLAPLPTFSQGTRAALWNAFKGPWGKARCILKYCNSTTPPSSPSTQGRYKRPWACSGSFDLLKPRAKFKKNEGCLGD